jgi:lysophospholipase II
MAGPATPFGSVHVVEPSTQHTHTAILLHGRGSNGEEFASELAASTLPGGMTLMQKLPGWRWVFPTSRELWSTAFEEDMTAWFEAHSLTDVTARQDLQAGGIRESVEYIQGLWDDELERLGGRAEHLVLGGISLGGAIGIWTMLCTHHPERRLGAFVAASTWLPFATNIGKLLASGENPKVEGSCGLESSEADEFVKGMIAVRSRHASSDTTPLLSIPVFLGHGADDAYVDVELGRQARDVLLGIGFDVKWKEYSGAEEEGHWLKVPEEVDDIADFLQSLGASVTFQPNQQPLIDAAPRED